MRSVEGAQVPNDVTQCELHMQLPIDSMALAIAREPSLDRLRSAPGEGEDAGKAVRSQLRNPQPHRPYGGLEVVRVVILASGQAGVDEVELVDDMLGVSESPRSDPNMIE